MADPHPESAGRRQMLRSAFAVGSITLLSRISGLLREATHANFLGTGMASDAFRIALLIPNVLRRLVGEGAVSTAFVPVFARHVQTGDTPRIRLFAEKFFTLWTAILLLITVAGMALAGSLLALGAHTDAWPPEKLELTATLTRWLFPYLLLVGVSAVAGGILNASGVFALPSATPLLFNVCFIAAGWLLAGLFPGERAAFAFAIGVLLGGILQATVLAPSLWRMGIRPCLRWPFDHAGVREVLRLLIPGTFGAGIYQLNVFISSVLAMRIPQEGAVAALGFAGRLMEFVLGVFVFALSTVSLTTLSREAAATDPAAFRATLSEVLRLTGFITIPSAVGLYVLREPIIRLLLESGRFGAESVRLTATAFQAYVPGLFLVGLSRVVTVAFYARREIWTPVRVSAVNLAVNAILSWALMGPLGHAGIALASTIAALVQAGWLVWEFTRREPDLVATGEILRSLAQTAAAALGMGLVCFWTLSFLPGGESGKFVFGLGVFGAILAGAAAHFALARLFGSSEAALFLRALSRRIRRP